MLGGLPGRGRNGPDSVLKRGDTLLEHCDRRVCYARIDVPKALERKKVCRLISILEDICARLIDRYRPRAGHRIGALPCVNRLRTEAELLFTGHGRSHFVVSAKPNRRIQIHPSSRVSVGSGKKTGEEAAVGCQLPAPRPLTVLIEYDQPTDAGQSRPTPTPQPRKEVEQPGLDQQPRPLVATSPGQWAIGDQSNCRIPGNAYHLRVDGGTVVWENGDGNIDVERVTFSDETEFRTVTIEFVSPQ